MASDTYAAGTLVEGQALAPLAKFNLYNGDDAEVKITQIKLKRIGVSADTTPSNIYLFDGAVRLTDSASVSSGVISFNDATGIIKIASGKSKTISVEADIAASVSGQTVGVEIVSSADITTNASSINGSFPMSGNLMTIATATLAGVNFSATTTPSANTDATPENDYTVWSNTVTISTRKVTLSRISFREIGTITYSDLENFRLFVSGIEVAQVDNLDENGYVTFDLTGSPVTLQTGARVIKVLADVIGGSSRTFKFSLRKAADVTFTDSQYGAKVLSTAGGSAFSAIDAGVQTLGEGVITITKMSDSPSGKIVNDASAALLAKYEIKASGEDVKIETLDASFAFTNEGTTAQSSTGAAATNANSLDNGMVLVNGVQIGSTTDISEDSDTTTSSTAYTQYSFGSSLIVSPGSPVTLEIYADVSDGDGTDNVDADDTIQITIEADTSNAQGMVSLATINVPAADVTGNTLTVSTGGLTLSKYGAYSDNTVVVPQTGFKLGWFTLTANTTEAVNLNTIDLDWAVSSPMVAATHLTNLYLKYGDKVTSTKATVTASNNTWSINQELGSGKIIDVEIYANVASGANTGKTQPQLSFVGTTTDSATTVYGNSDATSTGSNVNGQIFTFAAGTLTAAETQNPTAKVVAADQTITAANFKFTALYDAFTLKELEFGVPDEYGGAVVSEVVLKDGSTEITRGSLNSTLAAGIPTARNFTGLNISIPAGSTKQLTVDLVLGSATSDLSPRTSNVNAKVTLLSYKKATSQGVETTTTTTCTSADCAGNNIYVYKSVPTVTQIAVASGSKPSGNTSEGELYKFKIAASEKGDVAIKQLKFAISWSDGATSDSLEIESIKVKRGSYQFTGSEITIQDQAGNAVSSTSGLLGGTLTGSDNRDTTLILTWATEEAIPAGTEYTYTVFGTPQGFHYAGTAAGDIKGSDSFSLYMPTDSSADTTRFYLNAGLTVTTVTKLHTSSTAASSTDYNVIWSDEAAALHAVYPGTVGTNGTADWSNGNLILNLALSSESVSP